MAGIVTPQEAQRDRINECMDAVLNRFGSAVRGVYGSDDRRLATHIGSCTLLRIAGKPLIVTAAHVIDENKYTTLYVAGENKLVPIEAPFIVTQPPGGDRDRDRYDFAVAELTPEMCSELGNVGYIAEGDCLVHDAPTEGYLYVALGYPNSKNKKIDHANKVVRSEFWMCGSTAGPDAELQAKLKISDKSHLFFSFDPKRSRAADGTVINSINPRGISGGAIFDAGKVADPNNLRPDAAIPARLAGITIEYHRDHGRIVATRMRTILDAIKRRP